MNLHPSCNRSFHFPPFPPCDRSNFSLRPVWYRGHRQDLGQRNDFEPWQHTPRAPPAPLPPAVSPMSEFHASDHTSDTEMEADRQSLCEVPRGLVIGEVNEMFVCGICDGLLREPRQAEF